MLVRQGSLHTPGISRLLLISFLCALMQCPSTQKLPRFEGSGESNAKLNTATEHHALSAPTATDATKVHPNDWFDPQRWRDNNIATTCTYVENVCHSSRRFFYQSDGGNFSGQFPLVFGKNRGRASENPGYSNDYIFGQAHELDNRTCYQSPIHNHVVVFSLYNHMLGEWYDRALMKHFAELFALNQDRIEDFLQHTQFYLHMHDSTKPLLDSHHAFSNAFRIHPLLNLKTLLDETHCSCVRRLFFCGYSRKESLNTTILEPKDPRRKDLNGASMVYKRLYGHLQDSLKTNPYLMQDIAAQRQTVNATRLVGLTQRTGRRRWRNLPTLLKQLAQKWLKRGIALLEVNVEVDSSNPYSQMVQHGALDALIGIHGAQLTEAMWMKPGSLVVELLPFIPKGIRQGSWTSTVTSATPLGWIFQETALDHISYPLTAENAPYCQDDVNDLSCWRRYQWDSRDYELQASVLDDILERFVAKRWVRCDDYRKAAADQFVLCNVQCKEEHENETMTHHFFWPKRE